MMKKLGFLSFLFCVFLNVGCAQAPEQRPKIGNKAFDKKLTQLLQFTVPLIGVQELRNIQDEVHIFDTRKKEEYAVSHIAGARYLGYEDFDEQRLQGISKDAKIVLYCSVGYRSEKIGEKLQKLGYKQVYNLYGSIFEWANQGYPVVDVQDKTVQKVHTYNKDWSKWVNDGAAQKIW
ncbi:MAG: rhodanese-like domain-containing protein [Saprospiraceae bacterium]